MDGGPLRVGLDDHEGETTALAAGDSRGADPVARHDGQRRVDGVAQREDVADLQVEDLGGGQAYGVEAHADVDRDGGEPAATARADSTGSVPLRSAKCALPVTFSRIGWSEAKGMHSVAVDSRAPIRTSYVAATTMSEAAAICANCGFDSSCTMLVEVLTSDSKA
jgi:hypothetical protein